MHHVTYSMGMSLDGYITGPDGTFDWGPPGPEVFALSTEEVSRVGAYLLGRRLYESMLFWEGVEQQPDYDHSTVEFARIWRAIPKVVFSTTLTEVQGNARLATGSLAEEIARLRSEPGEDNIGIGGSTLAAQAASEGLIDEYLIRIYPVLVGGGLPCFARDERRDDLELVETRTFERVVYARYRVIRDGTR